MIINLVVYANVLNLIKKNIFVSQSASTKKKAKIIFLLNNIIPLRCDLLFSK